MNQSTLFLVNSFMLGLGLSMDAFSVSIVNGLNEPNMRKKKAVLIAAVYAFFQAIMPLAGWFLTHSFLTVFTMFEPVIPWIALALLLFIGIKMILTGRAPDEQSETDSSICLSGRLLVMQGLATSIDALSVGFTIAGYGVASALVCSLIIAVVTFAVCLTGVLIGKRAGVILAGKANIMGGAVLIAIGLEIFLTGIQR